MPTAGPQLFLDGEVVEGHVSYNAEGRVEAVHEGDPGEDHALTGLVTPPGVNAHTHIADIVARGRIQLAGLSLGEVVAPPDGLKHRILRQTSEPELVGGMMAALREAHRAGVTRLIDFREGGPYGARLARQAAEGEPVELVLLGRPTTHERWAAEADHLAPVVDGIGISGLADQPLATSEAEAAWCREHGKRVALHLSEARHESAEDALALGPDLVVHATHCTTDELAAFAEAGVPVAACPRSNALFGTKPPLEAMVGAGLTLGLGTDNAMFHATDVWAEGAFVAERWSAIGPLDVLGMVTGLHLPGEAAPRLAPGAQAVVLDVSDGLLRALDPTRVRPLWRVDRG